jgi:hypothetical protein
MPDMQTDAIRSKPDEASRSHVGQTFLSVGSGGFPAATTYLLRALNRFSFIFKIKNIFNKRYQRELSETKRDRAAVSHVGHTSLSAG